jgi:hypothetical protein
MYYVSSFAMAGWERLLRPEEQGCEADAKIKKE